MMINSEEYWNDLFKNIKQNDIREEQTKFFIELLLENLPKWLSEDIMDNELSICDIGCADGIGTELLSKLFKKSNVVGIDFSYEAIEEAKKRHSNCQFVVGDIKNIGEYYDVIVSSNVLEHFYDSIDVMKKMMSFANKYCIMLVPFREFYTIPEHSSYFDFNSFPMEIMGDYQLCYFKSFTMQGEQQQYWFGEQILVIYAKKEWLQEKRLTLKSFYNGYIEERTSIIADYDKKLKYLNAKIHEFEEEELTRKNVLDEIQTEHNEKVEDLLNTIDIRNRKINELQSELNEQREKCASVTSLVKKYRDEKEDVERKYDKARDEYTSLLDLFELNRKDISVYTGHIQNIQMSTLYRMSIVIKRFVYQFFKTREKKDFVKWFFSKLFRKNSNAKCLMEFDYLENIKIGLRELYRISDKVDTPVESSDIRFKTTKTVFIFGSVPYYDVGGGQRSAQMARTFNSLGYQVYYVYGFPCSEENIPDMFIPTVEHRYIDDISIEWFEALVKLDSIAIFEIPYYKFGPYLNCAKQKGVHTVYEHIDNWDSNLGSLFYDADVFKEFLAKADVLTVTAKNLGEKIREYTTREYVYLPNAVNIEIFEPMKSYECPDDLVRGKNKTMIYFGSLWGEWFDWELLDYLAGNCPDCAINLIGDYSGCLEKVSRTKKNIYFLGLKKQVDLPAYLAYSDIALLPFKNCEIGKYVSPLKIFEYIAMNIKVLATGLEDIQGYPNVFCSDKKEEWVAAVNSNEEIQDTTKFIAENNWFARCEKLLEYEKVKNDEKISVVVLNYNNKNVIKRCIDTLLMHKERYNYEVVVVDNKSTDGSYEMLKDCYAEKITLVQNKKNGCSSGRNLGVENAKGEYICFLDSDQWVISDYWLDSVLQLLREHLEIGAVAWNAGWFDYGTVTGPIVDYLPNRGIESALIWYRTDIAYLATSGFIMKKDLFLAVDGFDEFYDPTCFEDTDLSLKVRNAGYEIAYCPYMGLMHLPHQTTQSGSDKHTSLMTRNGEYFVEKWSAIDERLLEYYL